MLSLKDRYRGMILGTAVGDAIGLPAEGIPNARAQKMFKGRWHHRFVLGHGMISDDTEHTFFVVQSLLAHPSTPELFAKRLGWHLKWWFASLPAGIGLATARACIKLCLGFGVQKSGVRSAGNGAAMRVAPIGAFFHSSPKELDAFVRMCTKITHTDPRAVAGAKAVATTAAWIVREGLTQRPPAAEFCELLRNCAPDDTEWTNIVKILETDLARNATVDEFARSLGLERGVTGFVYHTVPIVLFAWHKHFGNCEDTLTSVLNCGGDTDTSGAIVGALAGLTVGEAGIPADWLRGVAEWPRTMPLMRLAVDRLADLQEGTAVVGPVQYFWPGIPLRNMVFLLIVLAHGLRRLLPPY